MGFKWNDAVTGAIDGFKAGSKFGPYGMIIGTVAGGVTGGYAKDIDKGVTGNSQSRTTEDLLDTAGSLGGGGGYGTAAGVGGKFLTSSADKKAAKGYEDNPAVLAREQQSGGNSGGSLSDLTSLFSKNSDSSGNLNAGNLGQFQGQDLYHSGSGSFQLGDQKGLDINSLLQMVNEFKSMGGSMGGGSSSLPSDAGISYA